MSFPPPPLGRLRAPASTYLTKSMAFRSLSKSSSILLLFVFSILFAQLFISDAVYPVRNDRSGPYCRKQITLQRRNRNVNRRPTLAGYQYHKRISSMPKRCILAKKPSNYTVNLTSDSTSHQTNSTSNATSNSNTTTAHHHHRHPSKVRNWILCFIAVFLGAIFVIIFFRFSLNCRHGPYRYSRGPSIYKPKIIQRPEDLAFLEKEEGLASLEVIGQGGCGKVYKARLPGNPPITVAIKQIMKQAAGGGDPIKDVTQYLDMWMQQIRSELRTISYIRHMNILPLVAHLTRPDCHFLAYEFMKNGSLQDILRQAKEGQQEFHWPARLRIANGIAAGLNYLHEHHQPPIIHRDLKLANILLDNDMEARIADFGLAKVMLDANTPMTLSNVAGTLGYIAPGYYQTSTITVKCDIYSFGVILAVLAMGKEPSDEFFQSTEEISPVKWLRNLMQADNLAIAIDPALAGGDFDQQIKLVLRIALFCTADDPNERPTSGDVKNMISQIGK